MLEGLHAAGRATGHTTANAVHISVPPQAWIFRLFEVLWQQLGSGVLKVAGTAVVISTQGCTQLDDTQKVTSCRRFNVD